MKQTAAFSQGASGGGGLGSQEFLRCELMQEVGYLFSVSSYPSSMELGGLGRSE